MVQLQSSMVQFLQIIKTGQKIEAPLLGLAKSIKKS